MEREEDRFSVLVITSGKRGFSASYFVRVQRGPDPLKIMPA
jgi:hypothetical protein